MLSPTYSRDGVFLLLRMGSCVVPLSREDRFLHPSPWQNEFAPTRRAPGPQSPAGPPSADAHRVLGHREKEVSLAVVLNLRNRSFMALQQDRLLWRQDSCVSAQDRPPPQSQTLTLTPQL